ncbi:uncharacterized protein L203_103322 [Cryptococcus depauperatus CBS 7841]|uniref:Uncharacterized protein n=1 Tax=Cryptococcus depauperatus CBS 7841 TaxID=1295531 RepID=A0A1E3I3V5_9TREE|nr:hypothetical protein L203_05355 [Cryptococcus depauperatus CBS 7841]
MSTGTNASTPSSTTSRGGRSSWLPSNPFEIPETRELIAQKIALGQITQSDVDLMEKGYRWMIYTPPAAAISFSFLIWQLMKKQYPRPRLITRLVWGGLAAGAGGFLGFGAAGVAAAMEVEEKMEDVPSKSVVFDEIAEHSRALQGFRHAPTEPTSDSTTHKLSPAQSQKLRRQDGLRRDFELPPQEEHKLEKGRIREESQSTWGYVKSWIPGWKN